MTSTTPELTSYIGSDQRRGDAVGVDINPADPSQVVARVILADKVVAADGVAAAAKALPGWRGMVAAERGEVLRRAADIIEARAAEIGRDLTREEGKTLAEGVREAGSAAKIFRYFAGQTLDPDGETYPSQRPDVLLFTRRAPLGVVSIITPWNFPILIPAWKIAPALAFGNTVVWKPADLVPLTAAHLTQALSDAGLPPGVLNLVLGKGSEVGDVLTRHPQVNAISFTGSTPIGRRIQAQAGEDGKKIQLELGGKNSAIILGDADLASAADEVAGAAFSGTGQKCTATSRVIVERSVVAEFTERLGTAAEALTLGDPLDSGTTLGPVSSADQMDTVLGYLEGARLDGARTVAGGGRADGSLAGGYFVRPTVLTDVRPEHAVAREEVFGPVAVVLAADSFAEAVAMSNDTPYGLSASLFTADLSRALRFADESETGIVKVNQGTAGVEYHVPFGGTKDSGFGQREQGKAAREFFTESKTVYISF